MKIKLSKAQWELIGKKTGWVKKAIWNNPTASEEEITENKLFNEVMDFINEKMLSLPTPEQKKQFKNMLVENINLHW